MKDGPFVKARVLRPNRFTFRTWGVSVSKFGRKAPAVGKMRPPSTARVSKLLLNRGQGNQSARDALIPMVYDELRRVARLHLRLERPGHTLDSAALVHEAYLRLVLQKQQLWQNRAHFFGVAAQIMRHILVDRARNRMAAKRSRGAPRLRLDPQIAPGQERDVDLEALDDALTQLGALDSQQSRIVALRFFGSLSIEETSAVLGISPATVKREWATARARLQRAMKNQGRSA